MRVLYKAKTIVLGLCRIVSWKRLLWKSWMWLYGKMCCWRYRTVLTLLRLVLFQKCNKMFALKRAFCNTLRLRWYYYWSESCQQVAKDHKHTQKKPLKVSRRFFIQLLLIKVKLMRTKTYSGQKLWMEIVIHGSTFTKTITETWRMKRAINLLAQTI